MSNIVAIVGRPNVGKSTLFNRLTETRKAIVHESSGVTRDRHYGKCEWNGVEFSVIDTGGYIEDSADVFEKEISKQVELAVDEADLIIFVVDVMSGVTDLDDTVSLLLKKTAKPVLLVVNKVDNNQRRFEVYEFYSLGIKELFMVSSINGGGTGELLDKTVELLPVKPMETVDDSIPKIAVVGRPNVGKSSLINSLIGEERNIVTPIAGTTRDTLNTRFQKFGYDFVILDTAGLRKKAKVNENIEFYSVMRSVKAIENSDICVLMVDATLGVEAQDINIFRLIQRNSKGVVIVVNKWDLIEKDNNTMKEFEAVIKEKIAPFVDVPIIFTSAVTKQRILKVLDNAIEVFKNRRQRIKTATLNEVMLSVIEMQPPPAIKGKYIRIKFVTQLPTHAPTFAFFTNLPQYIKDPYKRYLENKIRKNFKFTGVPLKLFFRKKSK